MFVKVSRGGFVTLEDRDNFRAFKLVIEGRREDLGAARSALATTAALVDAETAWVFADALRRRPEVKDDSIWQQSLNAMIAKARPHGWIDDASNAIKAHVEWVA